MSKSKIFFIVFSVLLLLIGSVYGYEYFTNKSAIEKADALYQEGKFDEALPYYKKAQEGIFDTYGYESWAGEGDIKRIKKDVLPTLERAKEALKQSSTDSLLVAYNYLKIIDTKNGHYRIDPISIDKEIKKNQKLAKNKILSLAKKSETQNPAEAIKLYSAFDYQDEEYKTYQAKINSLYKPAILQKYNEKDYTEALSLYNKMERSDKEKYDSQLKEPVNHSRLEVAKKTKNFALASYMNGEMTMLENITKLLLAVDSTSSYDKEAKTELENLNQEVAYKMGTEEYKAGNLDESLHFFAQIPQNSVHYKDASQKITEISQKLEKEHKDSYLAKKRSEAYAEIKKQLNPYLNNKSTYSVILADSEEANKKFKYTIVYQNGTAPTTKTTDFLTVSDSTYNFFLDDVGMEILSNKGQQITQAGYSNYVGNSQYGTWKQNDEGSFWEFYGKYALLSTLFNSNRISNRIYKDDYNTYNRYYRSSSRPYYGSVYVPLKSAVKQTPRFEQTVNNRSQKSWFYAKSVPSRSSKSTSTASTSNKSWYYGRQPKERSSYTSTSTASNRSSYGRSSTASSSSGSYSSGSSSSNKGYKSSSSSSGYKSSSSSSSRSSSSSSRTTRSSSSSSRSRSSSSRGGK